MIAAGLPIAVEKRLAECDLELSAAEWRLLPHVARARLSQLSNDPLVGQRAFGDFVEWLRQTFLIA
ncbi:MAG: hypothetical protein AAF411_07335 [Myxococcota bacterium]